MKKITGILLSMFLLGTATLQAGEPVRLGIIGGMNSSTLNVSPFVSRVGFNAGLKAELALPSVATGAYLDAGVLLSLKGAKIDLGTLGEIAFNPYYLEIPVHMGYQYAVNDRLLFFANAGPYVAYGLTGKIKADMAFTSDESENIFEDENLQRFDFGAGFRIGMELHHKLQLSAGYDFGFISVYSGEGYAGYDDDTYNRNLSISLAWMF